MRKQHSSLVVCQVHRAKLVGATSSEGFVVIWANFFSRKTRNQLKRLTARWQSCCWFPVPTRDSGFRNFTVHCEMMMSVLSNMDKNSSGDGIVNVNFLRRHHILRC